MFEKMSRLVMLGHIMQSIVSRNAKNLVSRRELSALKI